MGIDYSVCICIMALKMLLCCEYLVLMKLNVLQSCGSKEKKEKLYLYNGEKMGF